MSKRDEKERARFRELWISPEAMADIRSWEVSEETFRPLFWTAFLAYGAEGDNE